MLVSGTIPFEIRSTHRVIAAVVAAVVVASLVKPSSECGHQRQQQQQHGHEQLRAGRPAGRTERFAAFARHRCEVLAVDLSGKRGMSELLH